MAAQAWEGIVGICLCASHDEGDSWVRRPVALKARSHGLKTFNYTWARMEQIAQGVTRARHDLSQHFFRQSQPGRPRRRVRQTGRMFVVDKVRLAFVNAIVAAEGLQLARMTDAMMVCGGKRTRTPASAAAFSSLKP
jgi:hypothetical protein